MRKMDDGLPIVGPSVDMTKVGLMVDLLSGMANCLVWKMYPVEFGVVQCIYQIQRCNENPVKQPRWNIFNGLFLTRQWGSQVFLSP